MVFARPDSIAVHEGYGDDGKDPIKPWFQASVELGDHIGIRFGFLSPEKDEPEWIYLSHADYDGIGGFADILRERGCEIGELPTIPHPVKQTWWPFIRSIPLYVSKRERVTWNKSFGSPRTPKHDVAPESVAWHVFDQATTDRIIERCRNADYTVNSFLLSKLGSALFPDLSPDTERMNWMVPVNLRGKVKRTRDSENHVSFVRVPLERADTPSTVHRKIYRELDRGEHWASWNAYTATRFLPLWIKRMMIRADRATSQLMVGAFSNIGSWNDDNRLEEAGDWLFAPPTMRFFMIAAGCVTWRGRLSLCMHLHPEISTDPEDSENWVEAWASRIYSDLQ